ncbi:MAG TPA: MFS transporter [Acetobacteraceae bacterium]|jgi:MFS family permease|nr:MFS transporter [Acetobacteraceae bacterium]
MRPGSFLVARPGFGVLVVALGTLVVPFDSSVNFAFPYITRAFGLPIPAIQWVVIAYTLTYAALMLVFGRVGDMLGYRRIFLAGSGWSAIAFVLCAMAPSYGALLAARVLQGIGAALVLSCGPALATSLYPESARTRILGLYTMVIGLGGALGPPIAGLLVPIIDWPAVFWFRAPLALSAFVLAWLLPADTRPAVREKFDAAGGALLVLAISAMLLALNQLQHIGERRGWFIASALACLLAVGGFIAQETRTQRPIISLRYFRDFDFSLLNAGHAALSLAGFSVLLLVPFYLSRFGGLTAHTTGLLLACSPAGTAVAAPLAARLAARIPPRLLAVIGAAAMAIGQVLIGSADATPDIPPLAGAMALQGFGVGLFQVAYFDIVTTSIPRADRGVAGSLVMMTRTVGVVTGATVLMLLFQTWRGMAEANGATEIPAFLSGFGGTFRVAAALPALVVLLGLLRGWGRRRG